MRIEQPLRANGQFFAGWAGVGQIRFEACHLQVLSTQERTSEYRGGGNARHAGVNEIDDGIAAEIIAGMTSRGGDSAFEQKAPRLIVEESLPGSCRAEALRLCAIAIVENGGSWNLHGGLAQVCVRPLGIEASWAIEKDLGLNLVGTPGRNNG
jgi:hypothetical protein